MLEGDPSGRQQLLGFWTSQHRPCRPSAELPMYVKTTTPTSLTSAAKSGPLNLRMVPQTHVQFSGIEIQLTLHLP
jgi:hypothetical protein